jgi:dephospho-CoA kinase
MKTKFFGLTGGIASGKSTVTELFRREGVPMVDADQVAREIVAPGTPGLRSLVGVFGKGILLPDGTLDRPKLGSLVFLHPEQRAVLNQVIEPYLLEGIRARLQEYAGKVPLVGLDAALLVEKGLHREFRPLVVVAASPEVQVQRLMRRDRFSEPEARARLSAQLPLEEKVRLADYVIQNDGTQDELNQRAIHVLSQLRNQVVVCVRPPVYEL